ncbi:ImmA/IrrE family metallo-endopeptidase [Marivirga sp. S37H4]|uniref:ImmA/IrrE family metallo-endopeptidase n=1 Tax=Marivirga aurantiaca TaxID=2802615 RepID=A0A934WYX3_9BACT|nr:ImmA/IrrE family metallo-endopeptidase [Marivirga aurantiaca]MBK6265340.1 ImmA/IrrE family metallo-endopeptidase [Marivirga aurantiaca]
MTKSTLQKGDEFEEQSLLIINRMINESQIPHLREYIKIYNRKDKGYYSALREKNIFFDITVEVWPPGANKPSFTYFIECKNYGKTIPVDDVEEFYTKVCQVSGLNVKAILIANAPLQQGGYNFAKNKGIMFVQSGTSDNFNIVLYNSNVNHLLKIPLVNSTIENEVITEATLPLEELIDNVILSSFQKIENINHVSYNIDKLTREDIIEQAKNELLSIVPDAFEVGKGLNAKKLKEFLNSNYKIQIKEIKGSSALLGSFNRSENVIYLHESILDTERELFILAHEFGHFILHSRLQIGQLTYEKFEDSKLNFKEGKRDLINPKNWIEWQANQFASSLVLPDPCVMAWLFRTQDAIGVSRGAIYLDEQNSNQRLFMQIINRLALNFNVTKTSVIYKLKEMQMLKDKTRLKTIGQIYEEYNSEMLI